MCSFPVWVAQWLIGFGLVLCEIADEIEEAREDCQWPSKLKPPRYGQEL
jgi:hypothetical protein